MRRTAVENYGGGAGSWAELGERRKKNVIYANTNERKITRRRVLLGEHYAKSRVIKAD